MIFLSATLFIAAITILLLSPVIAPVIPLIIIISGVLFSASVISLLISYRSESNIQNTGEPTTPSQDAPKDIRSSSPLADSSQLVRVPITQPDAPTQEEGDNADRQQKEQAAKTIWRLFKSRNEALKNKVPNEYGIIEARPNYLMLNENKDEITENPHNFTLEKITYSKNLTLTKIKEIQPKRYYHYNNSSNKLNFVGVEPRHGLIKLKREVILSQEQKSYLTGAVKTPFCHNQRHIILTRNSEDTEEEKSAAIAQNNFFTNRLSRYQSIIPAYRLDKERYLAVHAGEELDTVVKSIKPESFHSLLSDLKKLRQKNIYIPDIKLNNIMYKNINGKDCISLIDVDEASVHPLSPIMPINLNYPAFFVSDHLARDITDEAYYYCMQNFVMLLMMYQADTKQYDEETLSKNYQLLMDIIRYDDPDDEDHQDKQADIYETSKALSFTQAYLTGFNAWVDKHVKANYREKVKLAIAEPSQHKLSADLVDIFDFSTSTHADAELLVNQDDMITIL